MTETKSTYQLRKVAENPWAVRPPKNHTAKDDSWETPVGTFNTRAPPVIPSPQMQQEQYSQADSWNEPVTLENKPTHPLRKISPRQMQEELYSRVESWDDPATFENKPNHPLMTIAENPWAAGQDETYTAEYESCVPSAAAPPAAAASETAPPGAAPPATAPPSSVPPAAAPIAAALNQQHHQRQRPQRHRPQCFERRCL